MLPLTRNIFRQTATSFNNTTKRWKQESYYIQIKWWSVAVCELLKNLHLSINKMTTLRLIITAFVNDLIEKDDVWYILVDSLHTWPMMLCLYGKRCIWRVFFLFFFLLRAISLLFHFKAFLFLLRPSKKHFKVTKYAEKTHVFKGKGVHDSGQLGLSFGIGIYL